MTKRSGIATVLSLALVTPAVPSVAAFAAQSQAASAAASAVKASPELITALSKEMGSTPEQAAGAAGALFGLAKTRLSADQFTQIAQSVPGMDSLLSAAPPAGTSGIGRVGLPGVPGGSGLASLSSAFGTLGLKPDMIAKAVPVLTSFVTKQGGSTVGNLLAGALK